MMSYQLPGQVDSQRFAYGRSSGVDVAPTQPRSALPPVTHEPMWEPTPVLPGGGELEEYAPTRQDPESFPVVPSFTPPASMELPPADLAELFPAMSLEEVNARASLQTRVDNKYLLSSEQFSRFARGLAAQNDWSGVDVAGERKFAYRSVYFDTPDLLTFRQHRQGRRRRFKFRTRSYLNSGDCMFEVKLRGARSATMKRRLSYSLADAEVITDEAHEFLSQALFDAYGMRPPTGLLPVTSTEYQRQTLVQRSQSARLTCDSAFTCSTARREVTAKPMWVVESKTEKGRGAADRLLVSMGIRPRRISKYCLATAILHPHLSANKWSRARREWF